MHYLIYKITNIITNEIYIGQHTTENINDNYFGSGTRIVYSIRKHGLDKFKKEILYDFSSFDEMNNKEKELVNEEFIKRKDTYNIILGGSDSSPLNTVCVELKTNKGIYFRIHKDDFDKKIYNTPSTGTVMVKGKFNKFIRIPIEEYHKNKHLYETQSTGRVSVRNKITNETSSILLSDFDSNIYEKVFGGRVIEENGIKRYVSKEEFYNSNYEGIHKGTVTVIDIRDNQSKHVSTEEYKINKQYYKTFSVGKTTATNKITGEICKISLAEYYSNSELWAGTTTGFRTVFDIKSNKFINIPKENYNRKIHRNPRDQKIICYDNTGQLKFEFWGSKKEFIQKYNCTESMWYDIIKIGKIMTQGRKNKTMNDCTFKIIKWKA